MKLTIRDLEARLKACLTELTDAIESGNAEHLYDGTSYHLDDVTISRHTRKTWTYSSAVKELQEQEVFNRTATLKETTYYRVDTRAAQLHGDDHRDASPSRQQAASRQRSDG